MRYSTADTMICDQNHTETSPFPRTADDENTTSRRPGGAMVRNYQKVLTALTKTVNSFDLGRQIYG
jgi:hypothetical protein